ncbi:ankyrin repeat-containing domain protein [Diplogelasinospora grovesii]|uniref:Ankyrin repeat-containing domain protein n=1 Tax=Diplogelasinospora grovesii TaxID=303347 RepID=A0AAN6N2P4_9PEZI|nr:ankyrin repeat-containing domain protein [Diplogelasinospora grovesii]
MDRPIIFICHSLGGLVVKRALVTTRLTDEYSSIKNATYCIAFFGTPHRGANGVALGDIAASIARFALRKATNTFLEALKKDSLFADDLVKDFRQQLEDYYILSFYETQPFKSVGLIVDRDSATLGLPLNREAQIGLTGNHSDICKFESADSDSYKQVKGNIEKIAERARRALQERARLAALNVPSPEQLSLINVAQTLSKHLQDKKSQEILDWIFPPGLDATREDPRPIEGTGHWLFELDAFKSWITGTEKIMWWRGQPGAGKTILTSIVAEYLESSIDDRILVVCIFCNYNNRSNQTTTNMVRNMLRQVLWKLRIIPDNIASFYEKYKGPSRQHSRPRHEEWSGLLATHLSGFSRAFFLIDALDEKDNTRDISFLDEIIRLHSLPGIRVLITSRYPPPIEKSALRGIKPMEIQAHSGDVTAYVNYRVTREELLQTLVDADPELRGNMRSSGNAEGRDVEKALETLPEGLGAMYRETERRIESQEENDILKLAEIQDALAVRPSSTGLDRRDHPFRTKIVSTCAGLVTIDEGSNVIRFVHYTAQEHFQEWSKGNFPNPHSNLATTCLTYLSFDAFDEGRCCNSKDLEARLQEYSFLLYSAQHWGIHARQGWNGEIHQQALDLLKSDWKRESLGEAMRDPDNWKFPRRNFTGLHLAAFFGLSEVAPALIDHGDHVETKDKEGYVALNYAASNGHEDMVSFPLKHGAKSTAHEDADEYDYKDPFRNLNTVLESASIRGDTRIVQRLLESSDDIKGDEWIYHRALRKAASAGHGKIQVVQSLVAKAIDANQGPRNQLALTEALCGASLRGHYEIAEWLIKIGAEVAGEVGHYGNALIAASLGGHDRVVEMLLSRGARLTAPKATDSDDFGLAYQYGHALIVALANGYTAVAKRLLESGADLTLWEEFTGHDCIVGQLLAKDADVNASGGDYDYPVSAAARFGHVSIVSQLLEKGANANAVGSHGFGFKTPLSAALFGGHDEIIRLLLEHGADARVEAAAYGTALYHFTFERGHRRIVHHALATISDWTDHTELLNYSLQAASAGGCDYSVQQLLSHGASINEIGPRGTALRLASANGHDGVVQRLIKHKVDATIRHTRDECELALAVAAANSHTRVVELLVTPADMSLMENDYRDALAYASAGGHEGVVRHLLMQSPFSTPHDKWTTALVLASKEGHTGVIQALLSSGVVNIDLCVDFKKYRARIHGNALQVASASGQHKTVQLLLEKGASVNTPGGRFGYALVAASYHGHAEIVQLLLKYKADANAHEEFGCALAAASSQGHQNIVEELMKHHALLDTHGGRYANALVAASAEGRYSTVRLLLAANAELISKQECFKNALILASAYGHDPIVRRLLEAGADANAQDKELGNALLAASAEGFTLAVKCLLQNGADVNAHVPGGYKTSKGDEYTTPLTAAAVKGHSQIVRLLLDHGANIHAESSNVSRFCRKAHGNALLAAAALGRLAVVELLLEKGADINAHSEYCLPFSTLVNHGSALHAASAGNYHHIIRLLLSKGANVNSEDVEGRTPLDIALAEEHDLAVELLLAGGAE